MMVAAMRAVDAISCRKALLEGKATQGQRKLSFQATYILCSQYSSGDDTIDTSQELLLQWLVPPFALSRTAVLRAMRLLCTLHMRMGGINGRVEADRYNGK
jgi:hypothetical protein